MRQGVRSESTSWSYSRCEEQVYFTSVASAASAASAAAAAATISLIRVHDSTAASFAFSHLRDDLPRARYQLRLRISSRSLNARPGNWTHASMPYRYAGR